MLIRDSNRFDHHTEDSKSIHAYIKCFNA